MLKQFWHGCTMISVCAVLAACGGGGSSTPTGGTSNSGGSSGSSGSSSSSSSSSSGSSSGSSGSPQATVAVSGTAIAALVNGGTITAYLVNTDGTPGAAVGTATTASDGTFSLTATLPSGTSPPVDLILSSGGGSYPSEANISTTVTNPAGNGLSALVPQVSATGSSAIVISPLTTLVVSRVQGIIAGGSGGSSTPATAAPTADSAIKAAFGFSSSAPALYTLAPDFTATSGDAAVLAVVLGALEEEALSQGQPPTSIITALAADYYDGVPDGKGKGGSAVTYPGSSSSIPPTLGSSLFLSGASTYLANSASPPAGVTTASSAVAFAASVATSIRAGVASVAPTSAQLTTSSSGAVSALTDSVTGDQIVLVATRAFGLQGIDLKTPTAPALLAYSKLNAALAGLKDAMGNPSLPSVDAVTAIPGLADDEAIVMSFSTPHVVLVDLTAQTVLKDSDFSMTLVTETGFSGGEAYISSAISNVVNGTVLLATGDGYFAYNIATQALGAPIALAAGQYPAENLGGAVLGSTFPAGGQLLSGNYGPDGSGGGLQIVNLGNSTAYAMDDTAFQADFPQFSLVDGNSVDTQRNVGVLSGEDIDTLGFMDLHDPTKFTFTGTGTSASFTLSSPSVVKTLTVGDDLGDPILSGTAVEPVNGLLLGIAAFSSTLLVGQLDNPASPASATAGWAGLTDWRFYNATGSEYSSTQGDPHAVGAVLGSDGKSYGVTLSINGDGTEDILLIDLAAFLKLAAGAAPSGSPAGTTEHMLAATPFGTPVIQSVALTNGFTLSARVHHAKGKAAQRKRGVLIRH